MLQKVRTESRDRISALVDGLGYVRVAANLTCCHCGRAVRPHDFAAREDAIELVCGGCHTTLMVARFLQNDEKTETP
jgi:hypothetical protein